MTLAELKAVFRTNLLSLYSASEVESLFTMSAEHITGLDRVGQVRDSSPQLTKPQAAKILAIVQRLKNYEPIQYILGYTDFGGIRIDVDSSVLIPRQETEELVAHVIKRTRFQQPNIQLKIMDMCTGSGCIALALKQKFPNSTVIGVDKFESCLKVAQANSKRNHLKVEFIQHDILQRNPELLLTNIPLLDILVSNPPYIPSSEIGSIGKNVLNYEPQSAYIVPSDSPLIFYDKIASFAMRALRKKGKLYLEINEHYGIQTLELIKLVGFRQAELINDINNKPRIITAIKED